MTAEAERSALEAEHAVLRECERRRATLLREQMDEKQTLLKHQLKVRRHRPASNSFRLNTFVELVLMVGHFLDAEAPDALSP